MSRQRRLFYSLRLYVSALEIKHPILGSFNLVRSSRARRISLTISSGGEIRLTVPVGGDERVAMNFLESKMDRLVAARERIAARPVVERVACSEEEIEAMRRDAKLYLPQRVEQLAAQFGMRYGRVTIRATRTRWGSCSAKSDLSLSLFLMQLPQHLRDFIILHELTHTIHHNHSPRFHAALNRLVGGRERELVRELKGYRLGYR